MDNRKSGKTAAGLMGIATGGVGKVLVITGEKAFETLKLERRPHTIIYDLTPKNKVVLEKNVADFLIDQNGYVQGYEPPIILAGILLKKRFPEREYLYTDINIKTKYNL